MDVQGCQRPTPYLFRPLHVPTLDRVFQYIVSLLYMYLLGFSISILERQLKYTQTITLVLRRELLNLDLLGVCSPCYADAW